MSSQSRHDPPVDPSDDMVTAPAGSSRVSRRSVLRGAAGASAVGLVTAAGMGQALAAPRPASRSRSAAPAADADASSGPIVVYLRDAASGELEVFAGHSQVRLHDPAMAARLTRAVR